MKKHSFEPKNYDERLFTKEEIRQFALDAGIKDSPINIGKWAADKGFKKKIKQKITYYYHPYNSKYYD